MMESSDFGIFLWANRKQAMKEMINEIIKEFSSEGETVQAIPLSILASLSGIHVTRSPILPCHTPLSLSPIPGS